MKKPTRKLIAKAIRTHHAFPIEHDRQHYAVPAGHEQYSIRNAKHELVASAALGDFVEGVGRVESTERHGLIVGGKTILLANRLLANTEARSTKESGRYHIRFPSGVLGELIAGQADPEWGTVTLHGHLLRTARGEFPIVPKAYEQTLLVFDSREGDGYLACLNTIEPGNDNNRKDGLMGSFLPPTSRQSARFVQMVEGKALVMAMFQPGGSRRKCTVFQRERTLALRVSEAELRLKAIELDASAIGVSPGDIQGHDEAKAALIELQGAGWQRHTFNIAQGHDLLVGVATQDLEQAV